VLRSHNNAAKLPRRTALKQNTLTETIYQELLARLQRGEIGADVRVLDYEIAEEFDCTRMPARQALTRLVSEGYLVGTTRGFVVPTITEQDIEEIFEVRRLLEPAAAASAVKMLTDAQQAALRKAYQKAQLALERSDANLMITANIEFRNAWLGAVQNVRLKATILRFVDHAQQIRLGTLRNPSTHEIVVEGMRKLLDAFEKRDSRLAKAAMLDFMRRGEQQYFALLGRDEA
jgi:DNA-binding GntR family transcriptional regulator